MARSSVGGDEFENMLGRNCSVNGRGCDGIRDRPADVGWTAGRYIG
ncbi:MAG: hypothetical protein ABWY29_04035 [Blastococcus sp.]